MNSAVWAFKGIGLSCIWLLAFSTLPSLQAFAAAASEGEALSGTLLAHPYVPPGHTNMKPPRYPAIPLRDGTEGWVQLHFMVDAQGSAHQIVVFDSFGHQSFQDAAVRAVARTEFEPALLDGEPVEAGHTFKVVFQQPDGRRRASRGFAAKYRKVMKLIKEGRRSEAEQEMTQLESRKKRNLYEDAFLNIARYNYHRQWGDPSQQLRALDRAIAYETTNRFLPEDVFASGLLAQFLLLVDTRDYARALAVYKCLESFPRGRQLALGLKGVIDRIEVLRTDDLSYRVLGEIAKNGSWHYGLLKSEFAVRDLDGRIEEVKLRCGGSYQLFPFDVGKSYRVSETPGPCWLQFVGEPGTTFALLQMGGAGTSADSRQAQRGM